MTDSLSPTDAGVLRLCLERATPEAFRGSSAIVELRRARLDLNTSYDTYQVTVRLAGGGEVHLFLKDFGTTVRPKDHARERRERETAVYRDLLGDAGLGTPRFYGSVMDEAGGRLWLLLELVDGTPVGYCEPGDCWAPAAEALGRMHGHFSRHVSRLRDCDFLVRHHADFFRSTAERALADVSLVAPSLLGRLDDLVRRYSPLVDSMTDQAPTLLHGGCRPSNILIRVSDDPSRVCILDWEEAALGAPLLDLAYLVDGIASPLLDRLFEAYRAGAAVYGMSVPPLEEMKLGVERFRLHMAFNLLGRAALKGYKESDVGKVLDYGEGIARAVFGAGHSATPPGQLSPVKAPRVDLPPIAPNTNGEDEGLGVVLESLISKVRGGAVAVTGWRREVSPVVVASLYPIEILRVSLGGAEDVVLFVKHLGPEQADHPDKQCRDREPKLYEDLLDREGLPVPRYYGSRWNERTSRREVFLEHIGDWSLKYQSLDHWFTAAACLARLHAHFSARAPELQARDYLLRLDAPYFEGWAARAIEVLSRQGTGLASELTAILDGYGRVASLLARQPPTLVHNDLSPKNVIADRSRVPVRVCFVDWEMAAMGCGLLDLAHLKHGLERPDDEAMLEAYCAGLEGTGLLPSSAPELNRLLAACDLHQTLFRIAHIDAWRLPSDRAAQWVAEAGDLVRLI